MCRLMKLLLNRGVPPAFHGKKFKKAGKRKSFVLCKRAFRRFTVHEHTLQMPLIDLLNITDGIESFNNCALNMKEFNSLNPCPLHLQITAIKNNLKFILINTSVADLLDENKTDFMQSISTK